MKVLLFMTQFYQLGGAERLTVELAEELNKRGIQADILSMYTDERLAGVGEAKKNLIQRGIFNIYFLGMKIHPPLISLIPAIIKLRFLIKENEYEIVETSSISPTVIATWATFLGKTRHVCGLHQVFRRDRENSWRHFFWRLSVRCNRRIRYYAISNYVNEAWRYYSNTSTRHIRTIYNAIQEQNFNALQDRHGVRRELEINNDGRIVLYVGRLVKYKGCDVLLDAVSKIMHQNNLYLLFVGKLDIDIPGSVEMLNKMKKQINLEQLGDRVKFLGYRKDITRLMASADVLAHPTEMEGFGLTLVEALAVGLPVVSSNVEGIPEILADTHSIMVSPNDPDALGEAIMKTLKRTPCEAKHAIEKGRKRADCFRERKRVDELVNLFDDVLSGRL